MYRMYDMIMKKRNGAEHTADEIRFIVEGFTKGEIPDYQMSAWLMCVYYKGMTHDETCALTHAMAESGDQLSLAAIHGVKVDKHSTGGVGDKTTFIVAPILASLGVPVAKMSGRGLGHTGGTIDKLEAIPGFCVSIPETEFIEHVNSMKLALVGQTGDLAPADKKIYALRDVTATVDSLPLIASSIMSKKLAAGADAIVLDVKCGSGAFMKNETDAKALAQIMVDIGKSAGRTCYGVITDMNEPLGCKVGNALEVIEAVQVLSMKDVKPYLTYDTSGDTDVQSRCDAYSAIENIAQQGYGADRTDKKIVRGWKIVRATTGMVFTACLLYHSHWRHTCIWRQENPMILKLRRHSVKKQSRAVRHLPSSKSLWKHRVAMAHTSTM